MNAAKSAGLSGIEAWNGLPGTVGGAVLEMPVVLEWSVKMYSCRREIYDGSARSVGVDFLNMNIEIRKLKRAGGIVLSATFKLRHGEASEIEAKMKEIAIRV